MGKLFQPSEGGGIAVFGLKDYESLQIFHQAALPGNAEFGGKVRVDMSDSFHVGSLLDHTMEEYFLHHTRL